MKQVYNKYISIVLLFICTSVFAQKEILTNKSIIDMVNYGFDEPTIISMINASDVNFNLSIADLKELKDAGVDQTIITTMINRPCLKKEYSASLSGIYIKNDEKLLKIYPSAFSGSQINTLAAAFTYGFASSDIKATLFNSHSKNFISTRTPDFYFYFNSNAQASLREWLFSAASSPYEFILVKLNINGDKRELSTGSVNAFAGHKTGISSEMAIPFEVVQLSDNEFKVTPQKPLKPGEYCFIYQGTVPQDKSNIHTVFDFTITDQFTCTPKFLIGDEVWIKVYTIPSKVQIIDCKEINGCIFYTIMYKSGVYQDVQESICFSSKEEAKNGKQMFKSYEELEQEVIEKDKEIHRLKMELYKSKSCEK